MAARTLRLAHRGDSRRAPENSLAALAAALAIPACDGLEFDVRASADGVPVICHDRTLRRVLSRPERVDALTAKALGELGVPTLDAVLTVVGRRPFLDVELKDDPGPAAIEILAAWRGEALDRAVVSSFEPETLEGVARRRPSWPRWLNSYRLDAATIADALTLGCRGVAVEWPALDSASIRQARSAGLDVASWTVRRRPTFDRLARLGVVAVCVEGPALDGSALRRRARAARSAAARPAATG
jgi:glycerophosphoryl diester phosphodiesterase